MAISQIVQNSISSSVELGRPFVAKPSITSPANAATGITDTQLITASPFLSLYGIAQANAQWQLSTSPTFAFINVASTISGSNTQFQLNSSSGLATSNTYYARVRYSDTSNISSEYSNTIQFTTATNFNISVEYVVVAGGGAGKHGQPGNWSGGGGGAGGYRSSVTGENSGGGASAEPALSFVYNTPITVTVGAGSTATSGTTVSRGSNSVFSTITSFGGGDAGGVFEGIGFNATPVGGSGGGHYSAGQGTGTPGQGFAGGGGQDPFSSNVGGGGGGAGEAGNTDGMKNGGDGVASSITGTPVFRAGGGGGGGSPGGVGGDGGGGNGAASPQPSFSGSPNTGGGGGGRQYGPAAGGNGGSGVVIIKYPNSVILTNPGGGLTFSHSPAVPGFNVTTFTAGTGSIQFT